MLRDIIFATMKGISDLLGRIFLGVIFIYEGLDKLFFYAQNKATMVEYGITFMPDFFLVATIGILFLGAFLLVIGYYARVGAFLLILYWVPFTLIVYSFWNDAPDVQMVNALDFMRNLAVLGGLFLLMANGSGEYSVRRLIHVMRLPK